MKSLRSGASLFPAMLLFGLFSGLASEPNREKPPISVGQAIVLAEEYVKEHHIDVSKMYIDSATLDMNPRGDRGPFWLITWEPDAHYSAGIRTAGGQVFLSVFMDGQIEVRYGE